MLTIFSKAARITVPYRRSAAGWQDPKKIATHAASNNVDHLGFLLQRTELELIERGRKSAERRLKAARLAMESGTF